MHSTSEFVKSAHQRLTNSIVDLLLYRNIPWEAAHGTDGRYTECIKIQQVSFRSQAADDSGLALTAEGTLNEFSYVYNTCAQNEYNWKGQTSALHNNLWSLRFIYDNYPLLYFLPRHITQ